MIPPTPWPFGSLTTPAIVPSAGSVASTVVVPGSVTVIGSALSSEGSSLAKRVAWAAVGSMKPT